MNKYYFTTEIAQLINPPLQSKYFEKCKNTFKNVCSAPRNVPLDHPSNINISEQNAERIFGVPTAKGMPLIDLIFTSECKILQSVYSNDFSYKRCNDSMKPAGINLKKSVDCGEHVNELLNYDKNKNSTVVLPCYWAKRIHCSSRENNNKNIVDENKMNSKVKKSRLGLKDQHAVVEMIWNSLKIKNHENFKDIVSAFRAYKNENCKITLLDLQKMCLKLGISAPVHVLEKLLENCEVIDKDGMLSYEEFMHALNWKDLLPENHNFKINSKIDGLPSPSKDNNRSKSKGTADFMKYGKVSSVIQPNAFIKYGVFEEDLNKLYTKEETKLLLRDSGIKFNDAAFDIIWQNVNENGTASIGKVWSALKNNCILH